MRAALGLLLAAAAPAVAGNFDPNNLLILRTSTRWDDNSLGSVIIEEWSPVSRSVQQTITLPGTGGGRCAVTGNLLEGYMTLSVDGTEVTILCTDADVGSSSPHLNSYTRVTATLFANGSYSIGGGSCYDCYTRGFASGAVSNGTDFWMWGGSSVQTQAGLRYTNTFYSQQVGVLTAACVGGP